MDSSSCRSLTLSTNPPISEGLIFSTSCTSFNPLICFTKATNWLRCPSVSAVVEVTSATWMERYKLYCTTNSLATSKRMFSLFFLEIIWKKESVKGLAPLAKSAFSTFNFLSEPNTGFESARPSSRVLLPIAAKDLKSSKTPSSCPFSMDKSNIDLAYREATRWLDMAN